VAAIFEGTDLWQPIRLTLELAAATTIILLIVGTPIGWWLARSPARWKEAVATVVALPLVLPPTVLGFYLLVTFGARSPLGQALQAIAGQTLPFSFEGLLLASAIANVPFIVQPIQRGFEAIPPDVRDAAACCGLTPWQRFLRIEVPLAWPSILTAVMLTFAHTLGEFGVVLMVGGNIPGSTRVVSIAIFEHVETLAYDQAHLLSAVLLIFSFAVLLVVYSLNRRVPVARVHG
jgi:molybdate transport system permease protein